MSKIYKTRNFVKWAKKERVTETVLKKAIHEISKGLIDADLGGGIIKKRIARMGQGKRGGHRGTFGI